MRIPTGCPHLDTMLGGGLPENRTVLLLGGPGVGKSTMAMQFLQEGLHNGEECLYVSTEQSRGELRSSFAPFEFDLSHPNLTITSIHPTPTSTEMTVEASESGMALKTLSDRETIDENEEPGVGPFTHPFDAKYVMEYLERYAPCDRVVLDSVSGLAAFSDDPDRFRRLVIDLIRLFTDTFRATTLFTAEEGPSGDPDRTGAPGVSDLLQFTTNGVIRLWWQERHGSRRRYLRIMKMRGIDHDTRSYETVFTDEGIELTPAERTIASGMSKDAIIPTGIEGLDEMSGGLTRGHSVLLEYDGRAQVDAFVAQMAQAAFDADMSMWLLTSPVLRADRFEMLLPRIDDIERMLDADRLFVLDGFSAWKQYHDHPNVFGSPGGIMGKVFTLHSSFTIPLMKKIARKVDRRRDEPLLGTTYTEAFLRWLDPPGVKEMYYWAREELAHEQDTGFFVHNPAMIDEQLAEFFHSDAVQVFDMEMAESGIQYLHLNKSPVGRPGTTGVLDQVDDRVMVRQNK